MDELPPEALGVEAVDDFTFVIRLTGPTPYLPGLLKALPAPLLAVAAAVAASAIFDLPIAYVSVPQELSGLIRLPTLESVSLLQHSSGAYEPVIRSKSVLETSGSLRSS